MLAMGSHTRTAAFLFVLVSIVSPSVLADSRHGQTIIAVGPLETVNCAAATIQVLGIRFQASGTSALRLRCASPSVAGIEYVVVSGRFSSSGIATAQRSEILFDRMYVPGASSIYLYGPVSAVDNKTGHFSVAGSTRIFQAQDMPRVGDDVEVLGTQAIGGSAIQLQVQAIGGSGVAKAAIGGSGAQVQAIGGSGVAKAAIGGSGTQIQAIGGSGIH